MTVKDEQSSALAMLFASSDIAKGKGFRQTKTAPKAEVDSALMCNDLPPKVTYVSHRAKVTPLMIR